MYENLNVLENLTTDVLMEATQVQDGSLDDIVVEE